MASIDSKDVDDGVDGKSGHGLILRIAAGDTKCGLMDKVVKNCAMALLLTATKE
jgi:hypothetical protein